MTTRQGGTGPPTNGRRSPSNSHDDRQRTTGAPGRLAERWLWFVLLLLANFVVVSSLFPGPDGIEIVGLAGSLRRASFHRGLIRAARELAPGDVRVEPYEHLDEIPFFNQDVESVGDPAPVIRLKEKIAQADAVLIATPEYDYAVPGVLTNALDWALRPPSPFRHKPVGIVGASPSSVGTARGQMVLRQILLHPPAYVMPEPQMLIPFSHERFDGRTGDLVDEQTRERVRRFLEALVGWTERFRIDLAAYERSK